MKNIFSRIGFLGLALSVIIFVSCQHDHTHDGHSHGETFPAQNDDGHAHGKIVHLNQAQFDNAEIDTGWFVMKNLSEVVHANGYTKLDPQDQAEVSVPISGTIKSIKVIEGSYVKRGQTLATMMSLEYNDKLLDKAELQEDLSVSESKETYLQKEYDRQKALSEDNINARKLLEKVSSDLEVERSRIKAIKKRILLLDGTLSMLGNGNSSYLPIVAPISGHITEVNLNLGATMAAGSKMFSIVDNSQMHVDLLVYEKDLGKVKVGQKASFILTNQSNQEIEGKIYNIGKSFANETKSVAVHADIEKNDANLIPGMYINALINIGINKVQAVPESAIVRAEGREFVFLWEKENMQSNDASEITFARLEVKTGARQLGHVEVTPLDEIHDGDKIVLDGSYYLQSHLQKAESGGGHSHN